MAATTIDKLSMQLWKALDDDSARGAQIAGEEVAELARECPELPDGFAQELAAMMNERAGGALLTAEEVARLKTRYPQVAPKLLDGLGKECRWPQRLRLFAADAEAGLSGSCGGRIEAIARRLTALGFVVDRDTVERHLPPMLPERFLEGLEAVIDDTAFAAFAREMQRAHPGHQEWTLGDAMHLKDVLEADRQAAMGLRELVTGEDFAAFADFLRERYGSDPLQYSDLGIASYMNPGLLQRLQDERNIALIDRIEEELGFQNEWMDGLSTLERLRADPDLDRGIGFAKRYLERLEKASGRSFMPRHHLDLAWLISAHRDRHTVAHIVDMARPSTVRFARFLEEHFCRRVDFEDLRFDTIARLHDLFGDDPSPLLALQEFPEIASSVFDRLMPPDAQQVRRLLPVLHDPRARSLLREFECARFDDLEKIARLLAHPNHDRILAILRRDPSARSSLGNILDLADDPACWKALTRFLDDCPGIHVHFGTSDWDWLTEERTQRFLDRGLHRHLCDRMRERWGVQVRLDMLEEMTRFSDEQMALLDDAAFQAQAGEALQIFNADRSMSDYWIRACLELGPTGLSRLLSEKGRTTFARLQAVTPHCRFDFLNLVHYRDALDRGFAAFVERAEETNLLGRILRRAHNSLPMTFNRLVEARPELLRRLAEPTVQRYLTDIARAKNVRLQGIEELSILLEHADAPGTAKAIAGAAELVGESLTAADLLLLRRTLADGPRRALLGDPEFARFATALRDELFVPKQITVEDLVVLLQSVGQGDAKARMAAIASSVREESFRDLVGIVHRDMQIKSLSANVMFPLIDLAATYDAGAVQAICERLGSRMRATDMPLLAAVTPDPALRELLLDRPALLDAARAIEARPPLFRRLLDGFVPERGYTERPPLEQLDSLALLRIVLIDRALRDEKVLRQIGAIAARDIADTSTEYGGAVLMREGRIVFNNVESLSVQDGAFHSPLSGFLAGGLMTFHLHALAEDTSDYAGPSGKRTDRTGGGDWGCARHFGGTDVVITACGRDPDVPERLRVNLDLYYYDDEGVGRVIDLGMVSVPFDEGT